MLAKIWKNRETLKLPVWPKVICWWYNVTINEFSAFSLNAFAYDPEIRRCLLGINRVIHTSIWFGEDHSLNVSDIEAIPFDFRNFACYILKFDCGCYKIGRACFIDQRLRGYLRDIKLNKSPCGSKNFEVEYIINSDNYNKTEDALRRLCRRYRIFGREHFSRIDKNLIEFLKTREVCIA